MPSARVAVRLRPQARGDELLGFADGVLRAQVTAPPAEGRANRALCKLIAKRLGIAPSRIAVVRGAKSRDKVVAIEGVEEAELTRMLAA